ncbi:hypothetical protein CLD22_28260, partial [Rubrivivax gelatinosus]|nr:hypothetical protein [Rubrivivax gelatinosus]
MESDPASGREPGGTVEPADRAAITKARAQTPSHPGERYELHDPFTETTYRASTMKEIVDHADRLQASRIMAVAEDGTRTPIHKIFGKWERLGRLPPRPAPPEQAVSDEPVGKAGAARSEPQEAPTRTSPDSAAAKPRDELEAVRATRAAEIEAALRERYMVKSSKVIVNNVPMGRTEYRYRGDTKRVAFTETAFKLATDNDNPSVARSMVDVAEARNWRVLRVNGSEAFKRQVWLEATARGVRAVGYEPDP